MAGFTIKPTRQLLQERGLLEGGNVQKFIDSECIRHMDKYTPMQTGFLKRSVITADVREGDYVTKKIVNGSAPEVSDMLSAVAVARYDYGSKNMQHIKVVAKP